MESETRNGRNKMLMTANKSAFLDLTGSSSSRLLAERPAIVGQRHGFYQLFAHAAQKNRGLSELGNRLISLAEHARAFRRLNDLDELSQLLINLPLSKKHAHIGHYYHALSIKRNGKGDLDKAARLLEQVAESAPPLFRVRAVQSLGGNALYKGQYGLGLKLYAEASQLAHAERVHDPASAVIGLWDVATLRALDGNHGDALTLLEKARPLAQAIRTVHPHIYYGYLNSLALELGEAGRLSEAERASKISLASPFASAYLEWHDTKRELELRRGVRASRSQIAFGQPLPTAENLVSNNVVPLHLFKHGFGMTAGSSPSLLPREEARVLRFKCRKESMAKQSRNTNIAEQIRQMSHAERVIRLLELISSNDTTTEELAKILEIAESVAGKGKKQG